MTGPGAPQPNGQQQRKIFRPSDMDALNLPDAEKARYKTGLHGLWNALQTNPRGSPQHMEAQRKIAEFSTQLFNKMRTAQGAAGAGAAPRPVSQAGQSGQGVPATVAGPEGNLAAAAGSPPSTAAGPSAQAPASAGGASAQGSQPQQQTQQGQQPGGARPMGGWSLHPNLRNHLDSMVYVPPQEIVDQGTEAVARWTKESKEKYSRAIIQMQQAAEKAKEWDPLIAQLRQKGPGITPEENKRLQEALANKTKFATLHGQFKAVADTFRKEQASIKEARAQAGGGGGGGGAGSGTAAGGGAQEGAVAANPQPARPGPSPQQPSTGGDAAKGQQQQTGAAGRVPGANGQAGQQQTQAGQVTSSAPPQASPVASASAQPAPGATPQQQQIKIEPGTQNNPPAPPPVNTAVASSAGVGAGMPSAGTPTTQNVTGRIQTPQQIATPTTGVPRSLSHTAALQIANTQNQSRASQQPSNVAGQQQQQQQGTPIGGTSSSAGVMGSTAQQQQQQPGHPHAHPNSTQPQATFTQKLPIPKHLPEKAALPPQPVPTNLGGVTPGRPTYTQGGGTPGGVMGQPVLPKIAAVQMEGEGERVMNRKKLDDLVRQVCGGQAEGQEGSNALTPDVEEVRCLALATAKPVQLAPTHLRVRPANVPNPSRFSAWLTHSSTASYTRPARMPNSAAPRYLRSATSRSSWSASTTSGSPVTRPTSCARFARSSPPKAGSPR